MIVRGDELHKMLAHHIGIRAFKRAFHIRVNNAQLGNLAAHIVVNKLRIILRADSRKRFALCLRNTEALKSVLNILGHFRPFCAHFCVWPNIGYNMLHIKPRD